MRISVWGLVLGAACAGLAVGCGSAFDAANDPMGGAAGAAGDDLATASDAGDAGPDDGARAVTSDAGAEADGRDAGATMKDGAATTATVVYPDDGGAPVSSDCYPAGGCEVGASEWIAAGPGERYLCSGEPGSVPIFSAITMPPLYTGEPVRVTQPCGTMTGNGGLSGSCCRFQVIAISNTAQETSTSGPACARAHGQDSACGADASGQPQIAFACPNNHPVFTSQDGLSTIPRPVGCFPLAAARLPAGATGDSIFCCNTSDAPTGASG